MHEPRDPPLEVVLLFVSSHSLDGVRERKNCVECIIYGEISLSITCIQFTVYLTPKSIEHSNDPSAGSPTETLLRLLLPLNDQV